MEKKYIISGAKSPTGFPDGESKASEIYNELINQIDSIDKIILEIPEARSIGLSYVEGFIFTLRDKKNGYKIIDKLEIEATERILKRFNKYV